MQCACGNGNSLCLLTTPKKSRKAMFEMYTPHTTRQFAISRFFVEFGASSLEGGDFNRLDLIRRRYLIYKYRGIISLEKFIYT